MSPVYKFSNVGGFLTKNLYTSALAGNPAVVLDKGSMYPLGVFTLASEQSTITFSNIPQIYTHLQIRFIARASSADTGDNVWTRFNSDSGSNYTYHYIEGDGGSATSAGAGSQTRILSGRVSSANATAGIFGVGIIDILDYRNTSKNKTVRTLTGVDRNGSGNFRLDSGVWMNTNAITSVQLQNGSVTNFAANSSFALYGIQA